MKSHKNLFPQVCAVGNVMAAARSAMQGRGEDLFDCQVRRHGLPIGNLTSQFFANVHLDGFDHFRRIWGNRR